MRVLTQQPQGKSYVDRSNKLGRGITFLWSGADRANDSANNIFVGSGVNAQLITTATSDRGKVLYTGSVGSITWRLYDIAPTNYANYSGPIRNASVWSQGIVFKYRNAATSSEMFLVTNGGIWNHQIYVDSNGFVQVRNPSWTTGVFLTSDNPLTLGSWVSVVVVWQSGNTRFYVNGVLQTQTNTQAIYTGGLERVHFSPVGIDILTAFAANTGWTGEDALSWHNNPWQLFKTQTSIREKLSQQFHFTDLLPTYPGLSNIRIPNRDSRGMFVPKVPNVSLAGGTFNQLKQPLKYWYPLPGGGVYVSSIEHITRKSVFGGSSSYAEPQQTPYGIGLRDVGTYEFDNEGRTVSSPGGAFASKQTLVGLFYLYNVDKRLANNKAPSLLGVTSYADGAPLTLGRDGPGAYWKNTAGECAIVVGVYNWAGMIGKEITNIPNGLHCLVLVYETNQPIGIYLNGRKIPSSETFSSVNQTTYRTFAPNYYWAGLSQSRENIGTVLFNGLIYKALNDTEAINLSKDPYSYFFKDAYTNKHNLLRSFTFDVPQAINKSSYVQTANMPRKFVPVNRAHPLTRDIKFATGATWRDRDAVDSRVVYTDGNNLSNSTKIGRYGPTFLPSSLYLYSSVSSVSLPSYSSHTLMIVGNVEQENYPYSPADPSTNERLNLFGIDWGDNNSFQFRIDYRGLPNVGILNNSGVPRYLKGSREVFPLRKLGVAICVVEAGIGTTLYINGKISGFTTQAESSRGGLVRRTGYAVNAAFGQYFNFNSQQYFSAGWSRALSPAEVQQISEDPWQIFQQPSKFKNRYSEAVETVLDISRKFLLFFG